MWWWHRVAEATGRTVAEAKRSNTAMSFLRHRLFLQLRDEESWKPDKDAWYHAQTAHGVYLIRMLLLQWLSEKGKAPKADQKLTDFLLSFVNRKPERKGKKRETPEELEARKKAHAERSMSIWMGVCGFNLGADDDEPDGTSPPTHHRHF